MDNTSYIALSGQTALWRQLDVVANNIANMNTPGFREQSPVFTSYMASTTSDTSTLRQQLAYVHDYGLETDTTSGPVDETGNPMDLAIQGNGFFAINTADGTRYTRAGRFMLDASGQLVTSNGDTVLDSNDRPIVVAPNEAKFMVGEDGTVSTENGVIGKIKVVSFDNQQFLKRTSGALFEPAPGQQPITPTTAPKVLQGSLEGSNVNSVVEMTRMIDVQRSYTNAQNLLDAENDRVKQAIDVLSRIS